MTSSAASVAITDSALHELMERTLDGRNIAKIIRSPWAAYSSFAMELLEFHFANGDACSFVAKDVGPCGRLEIGAKLKPDFLFDPAREVWMYQHVLCKPNIDAPGFYGIAVDADRGHQILLLENVSGSPLWQFDDLDAWKAAARWLGQFHQRTDLLRDRADSLIRFDAEWYSTWPRRALEFNRGDSERGAFLELLADRYHKAIEQLLKLPARLIHGEFVPSNVLVEQPAQSFRIRVVDWEMAALGPPLMDLADLIAGKWDESARDQIIHAYRNSSPADSHISDDVFVRRLNLCQLHKAVQWLGWSPGWKAPQEHSTDWFAEAQRLARLLDVV